MKLLELIGGAMFMVAGVACFLGHRNLEEWSFQIWTVPRDWNAPSWFRSASSFVVGAVLVGMGVALLVTAVT